MADVQQKLDNDQQWRKKHLCKKPRCLQIKTTQFKENKIVLKSRLCEVKDAEFGPLPKKRLEKVRGNEYVELGKNNNVWLKKKRKLT